MKRRAYLSGVAAVGLAGCTGSDAPASSTGGDEADGDDSTGDGGSNGDATARDAVDTYDDFEDLSEWDVLSGSIRVDEGESIEGSQSVRLESGESNRQAVIARTISDPEDFSAVVPGLTAAANVTTVPTIQLYDDGGNRIDFRRGIRGDMGLMRYNFGVDEVVGSPDLSTVTEIRIVDWQNDGDYLRCDDLHLVSRPDTGKVMIQFDDGYETDRTEGLPILEEYGYPAVTFVNPGRMGYDGRLDLSQTRELRDAGWTVANHTFTHPDLRDLSAAEQDEEIRRGKEWLLDHGFERGARYFAYPFGGYDTTTVELVEKHHELGFAGGFPVQGYAVNPQLCSRIGDPSADDAIEALDRTAAMNGITSLFYHELDGDRLADFRETIDHLHGLESAGEIDLVTPRDLESELAAFS